MSSNMNNDYNKVANDNDVSYPLPGTGKSEKVKDFIEKHFDGSPIDNIEKEEKNSMGDKINPDTGLPKVDWNAHKSFGRRF